MTELDVAEQIRDGLLASPQRLGTMELWSIRITGTGASYRAGLNEYVWRDASLYLNDEFLRRCNGLPVIWVHPETKAKLDSEEFGNRVVGTVMLPFIKGDEVWAVCRLYDAEAISEMKKSQLSTSPGVVFLPSDGNETYELANGDTFLIEGKPSLLDHIALVPAGVWDKGGPPTGVAPTSQQTAGVTMTEDEKAVAAREDAAKLDKIIGALDGLGKRMDAYEEADKARKDAAECEKRDAEEKAAKDRKDAEEAEKAAKDRKDAEETAVADRKDAAETEEEKRALEKANEAKAEKERDDARKDAAAAQAEIAGLKDQLATVTAFMTEMKRDVPAAERDALAAAQARADSVAAMFGDRAAAPMPGETSLAYRKRLLDKFKSHSPRFKESRFDGADVHTIDAVEGIIYQDAADVARAPARTTVGSLFPRVRQDAAGRQITTFEGDIGAFIAPFTAPPVTTPINRNPKLN